MEQQDQNTPGLEEVICKASSGDGRYGKVGHHSGGIFCVVS